MGVATLEDRWAALTKVNVKPPYDPGAAVLDVCPREMRQMTQKPVREVHMER